MLKTQRSSFKEILQPYIFISFAGLLAFAPLSFMLRAMKNDVIALEYPINHFISQCVRNGEIPYWFNTWGMGFPLQSNLTWGIFSTPQLLFSSLFDYNIYVLHIEFMFFVLLAGWSMFHLLYTYILKDKSIAQLLSVGYMLSGFMIGSTQWLLYITAAAFIPLIVSALLKLLYKPSFGSAFHFAVIYTLMFTSVYAAFNIITTYSLIAFILLWLLDSKKTRDLKSKSLKYLMLGGLFTFLLCFPSFYYTTELLKYITRGAAINSNTDFFNSNYLHPSALSSMLFPLSSTKMSFSNTEGTMLDSYMGLFILLLLPVLVWQAIKNKNRSSLLLFSSAILFLLISFGDITPARNLLNILPGFSYFRNPAIFRLYFMLLLIFFIATEIKNKSFSDLFRSENKQHSRIITYTAWFLIAVCSCALFLYLKSFAGVDFKSISTVIKNISFGQTVFINSLLQLLILTTLLFGIKKRWFNFSKFVLTTDLVINALICTPFFSVSNYSIPEVNHILHSVAGFPVQNAKPADVPAIYTDEKNNTWNNINIFSKQVSSNSSYRGPLNLINSFLPDSTSMGKENLDKSLVSFKNSSMQGSMELILQKPTHVSVSVSFKEKTTINLMQNYYPGWRAYYNNKEVPFVKNNMGGLSIEIPPGKGIIDFHYKRKALLLYVLILHATILIYLLLGIMRFFRKPENLHYSLLKNVR